MNDAEKKVGEVVEGSAEVLLQQLMHLKKYEVPEASRLTRNKQNIMRQVREVSSQKKRVLSDLIEVNISWFYAEPRYGIAFLFIIFAGLQFFWGSSRGPSLERGGIYISGDSVATYEASGSISTNRVSYPILPDNFRMFSDAQSGDGSVRAAASWSREAE